MARFFAKEVVDLMSLLVTASGVATRGASSFKWLPGAIS
jgi:hypothetical protein